MWQESIREAVPRLNRSDETLASTLKTAQVWFRIIRQSDNVVSWPNLKNGFNEWDDNSCFSYAYQMSRLGGEEGYDLLHSALVQGGPLVEEMQEIATELSAIVHQKQQNK